MNDCRHSGVAQAARTRCGSSSLSLPGARAFRQALVDAVLEVVDEDANRGDLGEAEPLENRLRHPPRLHCQGRSASFRGELPPVTEKRLVDAATARLGQDGAAEEI